MGESELRTLVPDEITAVARPSLTRALAVAIFPALIGLSALVGGFRADSRMTDHLIGSAIFLACAAVVVPLALYGLRVRIYATDEWVVVSRLTGRASVGGTPGSFGRPRSNDGGIVTEQDLANQADWEALIYGDDPPDLMDHCCRRVDLRAIRIVHDRRDATDILMESLKFLMQVEARGGQRLQAAFTMSLGVLWSKNALRDFAAAINVPIADPDDVTFQEAFALGTLESLGLAWAGRHPLSSNPPANPRK